MFLHRQKENWLNINENAVENFVSVLLALPFGDTFTGVALLLHLEKFNQIIRMRFHES